PSIRTKGGEAMSIIDDKGQSNSSDNEYFQDIVNTRLSRRSFLAGGLATAAVMSLGGAEALVRVIPAGAQENEYTADTEMGGEGPRGRKLRLGFDAVPISAIDEVVVPNGIRPRC
ncbi:MAG: twin-arginine translocation signal domain-containing protein, partial [Nitrospira sp.]|nr:twin-arginine translocation signal domain-containing protein [Nitrospira sp.]